MPTSDPQPGSAQPGLAKTETENAVTYVTLSELARRWNVDRATARAAIRRANISPSDLHLSRRFSWDDVLRKIEGWSEDTLEYVAIEDRLEKANALADRLNVTSQTIRNYGRVGLLHRVEVAPRVIRYCSPRLAKKGSEGKNGDTNQK